MSSTVAVYSRQFFLCSLGLRLFFFCSVFSFIFLYFTHP